MSAAVICWQLCKATKGALEVSREPGNCFRKFSTFLMNFFTMMMMMVHFLLMNRWADTGSNFTISCWFWFGKIFINTLTFFNKTENITFDFWRNSNFDLSNFGLSCECRTKFMAVCQLVHQCFESQFSAPSLLGLSEPYATSFCIDVEKPKLSAFYLFSALQISPFQHYLGKANHTFVKTVVIMKCESWSIFIWWVKISLDIEVAQPNLKHPSNRGGNY